MAPSLSARASGASKCFVLESEVIISLRCYPSITVPEFQHLPVSGDDSLSSSEVIMPEAAPARSTTESAVGAATPDMTRSDTVPSTPTVPSQASSTTSDDVDSSISLLDDFETASDEGFWDETRARVGHPVEHPEMEYVVLYDDSTDEE